MSEANVDLIRRGFEALKRGAESGVEVHAESAWVHTVERGRVVHLRSFASWKEGLDAVGLSG